MTAKTEKVINFENALEYPLCSVPLSLACPDGTPRKTAKSKLLDVLRKRCRLPLTHPRENQPQKGSVAAFIIDLMANIRMITGIPETYEDLTWVFIKTIPTGYTRIDIVADTYPENSIKAAEHCRRGSSREIVIRSPQSKIPRDFRGFLQNGKNKTRMIMLMREVLMKNQQKTLEMLDCKEIFFSTLNDCIKINENCTCNIEGLASNQEEADTKVVLHCKGALASSLNKSIILRSPSGDTDITIIMIEKFIEGSANCFLDYGSRQNRMVCG